MNKTPSQEKKAFLEIILFFLFMMILTAVITFAEKFLPSTGPLIGVLFYLFPCAIILLCFKGGESALLLHRPYQAPFSGYSCRAAFRFLHVCRAADTASYYENGLFRLCHDTGTGLYHCHFPLLLFMCGLCGGADLPRIYSA